MNEPSHVHRFVRGSSTATILALHGTGGDEHDLLPLVRDVAPSAHVLSPRGQVLEQGMPRFFRRLAPGVFDEADLTRRAADLAAFVRQAAAHYALDPAHIYALGYSNGANMAAALLLLHPEVLAGAILLRAMLPIEPPTPPVLTGEPVLIAAGARDPYAPREQVEALAAWLTRAGAAVDLRWRQAGHELTTDDIAEARAWAQGTLAAS